MTVVVEHFTSVNPELGPLDEDDDEVLEYGHVANVDEFNDITELIRRYYAATLAGNGARTCSMLYSVTSKDTVVEEDGRLPGLRGSTCPVVMAKLLLRDHRWIAAVADTLRVELIRSDGQRAVAVLRVPASGLARTLTLRRVAGRWVLEQPIDTPMP